MNAMLALDLLAAERGDGLHPALRALMEQRRRLARDGIAVLDELRADRLVQAGPVPAGAVPEELPEGVARIGMRPPRMRAGGKRTGAK